MQEHCSADDTRRPDTDETRRGELSTPDLRALRNADAVSFHHHDQNSYIRASLTSWDPDLPRIYTSAEQRLYPIGDGHDRHRRITVAAWVTGFDTDRRWHEHLPGAQASTTLPAARLDEAWRSITALLRAGDLVGLRWRADNNTPELTAAGLHRDELSIVVSRGTDSWQFLLEVMVRPASARMIIRAAHR